MKMKVLIVTSSFPNSRNTISGNFILDQINNINAFYDDIEFIVCAPNKTIDSIRNKLRVYSFRYFLKKYEKIGVESITDLIKKSKLYYLVFVFFTLSQLFKLIIIVSKEKPDLIYSHWFTPQALTSFLVSKIFRVPFKITIHSRDLKILSYYFGKAGEKIARIVLKSSSGITVTSRNILKSVESVLSKSEINDLNILQFPMGIDSINLKFANKDLGIMNKLDPHLNYIMYLGRLVEKKGLEDLIISFTQFSKISDYKLIIAGFGNLENKLKFLVNKLEMTDKIIFTGKVGINEKKTLFEISKILIVPSESTTGMPSEGMPVTILEGIYFGKIVIASIYTNCEDVIIDGVNGFVYQSNNSENLVEVLEKITKLNSDKIDKLTFNALESSKLYDSKGSSEIYYKFLKK